MEWIAGVEVFEVYVLPLTLRRLLNALLLTPLGGYFIQSFVSFFYLKGEGCKKFQSAVFCHLNLC